jgi:hypothetical protein
VTQVSQLATARFLCPDHRIPGGVTTNQNIYGQQSHNSFSPVWVCGDFRRNKPINSKERKKAIVRIKTKIKAGYMSNQHNQTVAAGPRLKTDAKAGDGADAANPYRIKANHSQTVAGGLRIKSRIKAGPDGPPIIIGRG